MLNHITIMGRLTKDPELRRTGSGVAVASFRVAVDRDYAQNGQERKTDFIDCVAWRQAGEFVAKYFKKGSMIVVEGRLEMRTWEDRDGIRHTSAEINVENAYFGESKRSEGVAVEPPTEERLPFADTMDLIRSYGVEIPDGMEQDTLPI